MDGQKHTPGVEAVNTVNLAPLEAQQTARARQGWVCNWTGAHCPSGCRSPCSYTVDGTRCGEGVITNDFNSAALAKATA